MLRNPRTRTLGRSFAPARPTATVRAQLPAQCPTRTLIRHRTSSSGAPQLLARLALEASYEATLLVGAVLAYHRKRRVTVYLTCVGGGAFGNATHWVYEAMQRACDGLAGLVRRT